MQILRVNTVLVPWLPGYWTLCDSKNVHTYMVYKFCSSSTSSVLPVFLREVWIDLKFRFNVLVFAPFLLQTLMACEQDFRNVQMLPLNCWSLSFLAILYVRWYMRCLSILWKTGVSAVLDGTLNCYIHNAFGVNHFVDAVAQLHYLFLLKYKVCLLKCFVGAAAPPFIKGQLQIERRGSLCLPTFLPMSECAWA